MFSLGALSFAAPVALLALAAIPALWWLLRVVPPAPKRVRFPAIRIIMRLVNPEESSAKTPLWLTLLRIALILLVIVGAAHPILNAQNSVIAAGPPLAVTESVVGEFTVSTAPAVGVLNVIAGAEDAAGVTVTAEFADAVAPFESVIFALRVTLPVVLGVHETE